MSERMAIIAGSGDLPQEVARACPNALFVTLSDAVNVPLDRHFSAHLEAFGALFEALHENNIKDVIFAGALSRPHLDVSKFDAVTTEIWPRLMAAMGQGDDGLLREIIALFTDQGFQTLGAHEAAPGLLATAAMTLGPAPNAQNLADIERGFGILTALCPYDVGQSIIVEGGQVLGIETLQGTDAMLTHVAATPAHLRRGRGVFMKTAKLGQDLRIDMPVIGPQTIRAIGDAGLAGLVIEAGRVMILDQAQVFELIAALGLFLVVR